MLLGSTNTQEIYRLRPTVGEDSYGDPYETWDPPQRHRLRRAEVQDVATVEEEGVRRVVVEGERRLYVPYAADLTSADRIEVDGETWRISGKPAVRRGLASTVYTTCTLTQTETS